MNKKIIAGLFGISAFFLGCDDTTNQVYANTILNNRDSLKPVINPVIEKIGDREKMKITINVEDRSGSGIREIRDYNNNIVNNNYSFEINRRGNYTFTAIDNNGNQTTLKIDDSWVNPYLTGNTGREIYGSAYWVSSNLREWLNSNAENVSYTSIEPDYKDEAGFLSNFTEEEQNAILITQRKTWLSQTDSYIKYDGYHMPPHGNNYASNSFISTSLYSLVTNYNNVTSIKTNEKVFLLSPTEAYHYIEKRGNSLVKKTTSELKNKHNISKDTYDWYLQGYTLRNESDGIYSTYDYRESFKDSVNDTNVKKGIVPAINIDKNYIFSTGIKASDLNIGDIVTFGKYLEAPMEWEVVNISSDNVPLLLSKKVIDIKSFDKEGDQSRMYSDYIEFSNYDVDMYNNIDYKPTNDYNDTSIPTITMLNKEESVVRQNGSYLLNFEVEDNDSGIDYIVTPDGNKIVANTFSYLVTKNGPVIMKAIDKAGNCNNYLIYLNNINAEPQLSISASESGWTNNDVLVDIDSSNNVKYIKDSAIVSNTRSLSGPVFPNYVDYAGKEFAISGTVDLISCKEELLRDDSALGIRVSYKSKNDSQFGHTLGGRWISAKSINIKELIANGGQMDFNFNYVIENDYAYELSPFLECTSFNSNLGTIAELEVRNIKYELTERSNFDIESITLHNGDVVNESSYIDRISTEGINSWEYKVYDSRGKETVKTITTKIDKVKPNLNLSYNDKGTNEDVVVSISASDSLSGIKHIKLPNGEYINNLNSTYTITQDGTYIFECEDVAGNIITKTIIIDNIDVDNPTINVDKNNDGRWTNKPISININVRD